MIRVLRNDDAKSYRALRLYSYQESPYAFSESYEDEVVKDISIFEQEIASTGDPLDHFIVGAFEDEELIGFVKFRRDRRTKALHKSMIHAMYVHPDHRQSGIGSQLLEYIIDHSKKLNGLEQIHLWVLHADDSASNFYAKSGWIRQGPLVKKDMKVNGRYVDAEYMVLYLDGHTPY